MAKARAKKSELWLMAIEKFRENWPGWIDSAIWFFALMAPLHAVFLQVYRPIVVALRTGDKVTVELALPAFAIMAMIYGLIFAQAYFFQVFFLQREPLTKAPKINFENFMYCIGKFLQLVLIVIAILAGVVMICMLLGLLLNFIGEQNTSMGQLVSSLVPMGFSLFIAYIILRYSLFFTLAISGVRGGLKKSWQLTRGNVWRLTGNTLLLAVITMSPMALVNTMHAGVFSDHVFLMSPSQTWVNIMFTALWTGLQAVAAGVFASFHCVCCRTLVKEKRQSDTSFSLTTSK